MLAMRPTCAFLGVAGDYLASSGNNFPRENCDSFTHKKHAW